MEFLPAFHALGSGVDIEDRVFKDLEKFTCLMYGSKLGDMNSLTCEQFIERFIAKPGEVLTSYNGVVGVRIKRWPCSTDNQEDRSCFKVQIAAPEKFPIYPF